MSASTISTFLAPHTPNGREEAWRFTPMNRLKGLHQTEISATGELHITASLQGSATFQELPATDPAVLPSAHTDDSVVHNARTKATFVSFLSVPKNEVITTPIRLTRTGRDGEINFNRTVIEVGAHSSSTIILEHFGDSALAEDLEIRVGENAELTLISTQEWADEAVHVASHAAFLAKDARFTSIVVSVGGSLVRISPRVDFTGPGASCELFGLYFATEGQHLEHRLHVEHGQPNCRSRVTYKGALSGYNSRSVWIGDVAIRPNAEGTDTYELNRNLLLTDGARADSVPNLEIETGEIVGAGHASTTGRFDDEQLFYLQSRGIPQAQARLLVVRGYFAELLAKITDETTRERLTLAIESELEEARP
ncbi:FeS cluster assembly protein SufD [mine drainage metagenome]|uniref:FeS cluster assembly protein SufD n=1 Tax=mine drainage metagenome TaxID=410659 RepID=A0A1J5PL35_9ZZZZ